MVQEDRDDASQERKAAALRGDVGDGQGAQGAQGVGQEADAGQGGEGISSQRLAATKESPSALDGYERAKPGEPIFTLQGGDPLGVKYTKLYIHERRRLALLIEDPIKQQAELLRCMEAERTLWAMQAYLRAGHVEDKAEPDGKLDTPATIDLHDRRVRAAGKISYMRGDLEEMLVELLPDWLAHDGDAPDYLMFNLFDEIDRLHDIYQLIEPRRMMLEPYPKIG